CTLFLVLILSVLTGAQTWKQTYLPGWNEVRAVCVNHDKTKVFIGTEAGVYVSSDNGVNWSKSNSGWGTDNQVNQLLIRGNNIYASTYSNIYVSYNDGISWTKLNPGWSSNSTLWSFAVSGQNITTGYYTFYVSTDYSINN